MALKKSHKRNCAWVAAKVRAAFNTPENCERLRQAAECGDEAAVLFLTVRGADANSELSADVRPF